VPSRLAANALPTVMIRCTVTGAELPTGFSAVSSDLLDRMQACVLVVWCPSCAQNHEWTKEDAFLR
jgi:hypothetical protein